MALEKFISGKKDSHHHDGLYSNRKRLQEAIQKLKDYMSHERYTLEQRLRVPFAGSLKSLEPISWHHENGIGNNGDVMIVDSTIPQEEINQLIERHAIFPMNTGEGVKDIIPLNPVPERIVFQKEPHI